MLFYKFWKELIDDIKSELLDKTEYAVDMLAMIIFTPVLLIVDIIILPYSLCYLFVNLTQKKGE